MREAPLCVITVRGTPVSANRMYAGDRLGRRFLTKPARAWKKIVSEEAAVAWYEQARRHYSASHLLVGQTMHVHCVFFGMAAGDADNLLKCTIDGVKAGIGIDDKFYGSTTAEHGQALAGATKGAVITITAQNVEALFKSLDPSTITPATRRDHADLVYTADSPFLDATTKAALRHAVEQKLAHPRKPRKDKRAS